MSEAPSTGAVPGPARPSAPLSPERKWLPALGVLVVILAVVLGGFFAAGEEGAVAGSEPAPGALPVEVVPGVAVTPVAGWEVAETFADPPGLRLTSGAATLDILVVEEPLDAEELYHAYVSEVLRAQARQLRAAETPESVRTSAGVAGVRGSYVGTFDGVLAPIEGEVSTFVGGSGSRVVFDGWAAEGQLLAGLDALRVMVEGAML